MEFLQVAIEDRATRDAALLLTTFEYVRLRSYTDIKRVLAAAAESPLSLMASALSDSSSLKRSNIT